MPEDYLLPEEPEEEQSRAQYEESFLAKARDRFRLVSEAEHELREVMLDDLSFFSGDQWPDYIVEQRGKDRPCLTVNRLPQLVHAVSNEMRLNKPAPKVSPVDDTGDVDTAEVYQGILRYIERQSNAPVVRSYAGFYAIVQGRGYYRIVTEYVDPYSFDQDILIKRIKNPQTVYMDPECNEPDCCDATYCFIVEDMTEEKFREKFPDAKVSSLEDFRSIGDGSPLWGEGKVRVAEYFTVETIREPVALLESGEVLPLADVPEGVQVRRHRMAERKQVRHTIITAAEILEEKDWAGYYIPVVRVVGEEYDVDGETQMVGMVRHAKDPQRMLNYWESAKTETIALAPRVPYVAAEGQLEGHEKDWAAANRRNFAYLQYKPVSLNGTPLPPPQRQVFEPPVQAITMAEMGAIDNLKATTGIYDASLGARTNETTGIAIRQRIAQGDTGNFHYIDNMAMAVHYEGKVLIDLIPRIYDRPGRVIRIIGEDGTEKNVRLNQPHPDKAGMMRYFDLSAGRYDLAIDVGPSQTTRRRESVESMTAFAQAAPQLVPLYADLYVQAMDWPGAKQIAERVRPPNVPDDDAPPIPPQAMQQLQQLTMENQQLKAGLQQAGEIIRGKQVEQQGKERISAASDATRMQIAQLQAQVDLLTKRMDVDGRASDAGVKVSMQESDLSTRQQMQDESLDSAEYLKRADIDSRERIAAMNARVKIRTEQERRVSSFDGNNQ